MSDQSTEGVWAGLRRVWVMHHAARHGYVQRKDLARHLGVSPAQASADLQDVQQQWPGCFRYNMNKKRYEWTGAVALPLPPAFVFAMVPEGTRRQKRGKQGRRPKADWSSVNWSRKNISLAKSLGVTTVAVSAARKRYAPETMRKTKSNQQKSHE